MSGTLLLRADGNPLMGTGHLMRCLALAEAWRARGGSCRFIARDEAPGVLARLEARGFTLLRLNPAVAEADDLAITLAEARNASWVVLDGYHFGPVYQAAIRAEARCLIVDDTAHQPVYHGHLLLNQNIYAEQLVYSWDSDTLPLLGTRYALLRPEFGPSRSSRRPQPEVATRVLITIGGSDPADITGRAVAAVARLGPEVQARVVVGAANPKLPELRCAVERSGDRITLLEAIDTMAEQMAWADVAISAGGSTCWELLCMGLPSLVVPVAENQLPVVGALAALGLPRNLGDPAALSAASLADELGTLLYDLPFRRSASALGPWAVDGLGADRVCSTLADGRQRGLAWELRLATAADAFLTWQWANDPELRRNSFNHDPIPWESHLAWFQTKLDQLTSRVWILQGSGVPLGMIRYDRREGRVAEISYSVARAARGRGLGTQLLKLSAPLAGAELDVSEVTGTVFADNAASVRAFERAGFVRAAAEQIDGRSCLIFRRGVA